jgi:predicted metal-dependent hydrolase
MQRTIRIDNQTISYTLRRSRRARRLRLNLYSNGSIVVTLPYRVAEKYALQFVHQKADWISKHLEVVTNIPPVSVPWKGTQAEFTQYKEQALQEIQKVLKKYNAVYGFSYKGIVVRNQKTRWGSCSTRKNLSFNYRLLFLPKELMAYVIVHELCHLKEMNHSKRFWQLVEQTIPEWRTCRIQLRSMQLSLR